MPSSSNLPLHFHRDRTERQLDARLDELLEKLRKNRPSEDPWMVRRAYEIAAERHRDQLRSSGDPYLTHLLEVAHILADMRLDAITLTAPLRGSSATTAPLCPASAASATCWARGSSVVMTFSPRGCLP